MESRHPCPPGRNWSASGAHHSRHTQQVASPLSCATHYARAYDQALQAGLASAGPRGGASRAAGMSDSECTPKSGLLRRCRIPSCRTSLGFHKTSCSNGCANWIGGHVPRSLVCVAVMIPSFVVVDRPKGMPDVRSWCCKRSVFPAICLSKLHPRGAPFTTSRGYPEWNSRGLSVGDGKVLANDARTRFVAHQLRREGGMDFNSAPGARVLF